MGFLLKSAMGLGVVYFAMFGQALHVAELAPAASLCAGAAAARLSGDGGARAPLATAGCALAVSAEAGKLAAAKPAKSAPAVASVAPAAEPARGTLTQADLRDPWFGPAPRKGPRRG